MRNDQIKEAVKKHGSPLLITILDNVNYNYEFLSEALPNVTLYYALKPFPHERVVRSLNSVGAHFDVATTGEIKVLKKVGVTANKCIHTHPIKREKDIREAINFGITQFVVDNVDEILKFRKFRKKVNLLLRVSFRNPTASIDLSKKFGCRPEDVLSLVEFARSHGIRINGLSFHVGSQCKDSTMHVKAINVCNDLIAQAILKGLPSIDILDIGGGFPAQYSGDIPQHITTFCEPIVEALTKVPQHVKIIAEPGRYIVANTTISVSTVIGKAVRDDKPWYYIDDGVYGSYSSHIFDHVKNESYAIVLDKTDIRSEPTYSSVIAGPTCDSVDIVHEDIMLPDLKIGDLIVGRTMGAYSSATSTNFNFFDKAKHIFVD